MLSGLTLAFLAHHPAHAGPARDDRPSVVLVIADDAGWIDFGFHGSSEIATPELDRLAAEGVVPADAVA